MSSNFRQKQRVNGPAKQARKISRKNFQSLPVLDHF